MKQRLPMDGIQNDQSRTINQEFIYFIITSKYILEYSFEHMKNKKIQFKHNIPLKNMKHYFFKILFVVYVTFSNSNEISKNQIRFFVSKISNLLQIEHL